MTVPVPELVFLEADRVLVDETTEPGIPGILGNDLADGGPCEFLEEAESTTGGVIVLVGDTSPSSSSGDADSGVRVIGTVPGVFAAAAFPIFV